jgi:Fe2+ transport system protein FeoA
MTHDARVALAFIRPGTEVRLALIAEDIDPLQREQLLAYGLAKGRSIRVLQQQPMTVILADELELALENSVARHLWVEQIAPNPEGAISSEYPAFVTEIARDEARTNYQHEAKAAPKRRARE